MRPPRPAPAAGPNGPIAPYKSAALFVGDLHPEVQERDLFEIFNAVAPVSSVRVCRHAITRTSLGYAYVNFHSIDDADRVMENMNYTNIKGRMCRLMWSQRDPAFRRSGQGNIFIRGLDKSIDSKDLHDSLSVWGNIISCKVVVDRQTGESKGYGFVHFETQEGAQQAIKNLNGNLISGKKVTVGAFVKRDERQSVQQWTNLFVKNIPLDWDEEKFHTKFAEYGAVSSIKLSVDVEGNSKGFGFCDFATHDNAKAAVDALHEMELGEDENGKPKKLYVTRFLKAWEREKQLKEKRDRETLERAKMYQGKNLYVKNLHESCTDEQLRTHFGEYGTVTSAKVSSDKSGRSKGFGFVCFSEKDSAIKALQQHQKMFMDKPLHVAMWQPKTERSQLLKVRHNQRGGPNPHGMSPMMNNYPGMQHMYPPRHMMRPMYRMSRGYPTPPMYQQMMAAARSAGQHPPQQMYPHGGYPMNQHMQRVPGGQNDVRNNPPPQQVMQRVQEAPPPPQQQQQQQQQQVPGGNQTLTAPELAAAPESERKMMIGNSLYPKIGEIVSTVHDPAELGVTDLAGKITGMLLDGIPDIADLVSLLDNDSLLKQRVASAVEVLRKDQQDKTM
jgi:polyadenylate-binding protein